MASLIHFTGPPAMTLLVDVYPLLTDVALVTDLAATELPAGSGFYDVTHAGTEKGLHRIVVHDSTPTTHASYFVHLSNSGIRDFAGDNEPQIAARVDGNNFRVYRSIMAAIVAGRVGGPDANNKDFHGQYDGNPLDPLLIRLSSVATADGNRTSIVPNVGDYQP